MEISEERRAQLRAADRRRYEKNKAARKQSMRVRAKKNYTTEAAVAKSRKRRADASAAFRDWLRAERVRELRRGRTRTDVLADLAVAAYAEWFEALDEDCFCS